MSLARITGKRKSKLCDFKDMKPSTDIIFSFFLLQTKTKALRIL